MVLRILSVWCFFCLTGSAFSQHARVITSPEVLEDTIEMEVQLQTNLDSIRIPPYCGRGYWKLTLSFSVLNVIQGAYDDKLIQISIGCPREAIEAKEIANNGIYVYKLVKCYDMVSVGVESQKVFNNEYEIVY